MAEAPTPLQLAPDLRQAIREATLHNEASLAQQLVLEGDIGSEGRLRAQKDAAAFVHEARANAGRSSLIDKFLQEYGLSTAEGVTLMRLAEALLRTPDAATADALIQDKVDAGDWSAHKGKSPFPLVNFSTRALMMTAAWLDDIEAKDPTRRVVKATKDLMDRVGDPVIRAAVGQAMRIMGEHFVLGQTIEEALKRGRDFAEKGYTFSFDMLGEAALTAADADKFYDEYAEAIANIAKTATSEAVTDNPGISIKLSALHPRYEIHQKERVMTELAARVKDLALKAKAANLGFNIDAEETDRLDISLDLIDALLQDPDLAGWDGFGVVVQAYQRRATHVLRWLIAATRAQKRRIMVRLVKGAYWDGEIKRAQVMGLETYPVFTRKVLTDVSFVTCARMLLENADVIYPQFATHNALTAALTREMAGPDAAYELQRLHGMGEALHDRLLKKGVRSRIYAPVGGHKELLPYLVRRLLENGANSSFVNQLIDPDLSVDEIVADPIDEIQNLSEIANSAIRAPRDLFAGERLSAQGWDDTDRDTIATLEKAVVGEITEDDGNPFTAMPLVERSSNDQFYRDATLDIKSPIDPTRVVGHVVQGDEEIVAAACESAREAQKGWMALGAEKRAIILRRAADALEREALSFMRFASQEAGKSIPDAIAEVREAVDFLRFYPDEAVRLETEQTHPLGVVACISPWNFPLAIFLGQITGALAAGNAVIAKPAEQTPLIAYKAVKLMHDAGVPKGVLQYIPGDGPAVGGPLVSNSAIDAVMFTGSTQTAQIINRSLAQRSDTPTTAAPILIAETGGLNAMIIDSTALLEQAVKDVIESAFQSAGQRCSACRIVCVQQDIAPRFEEMLAGAMAELTVGDPANIRTDVGPIIDEEAQIGIRDAVDRLKSHGRVIAEITQHPEKGWYIPPIAVAVDALSSVKEEIFGPVLQVVTFKAAGLPDLINALNDLGYGLTLGIHTRIDETMHDIVSRARVGNIYVNRNQIGAVVGVQPFGGEGLSGTGPKAGGPYYVEALRRPKEEVSGDQPEATGSILTNDTPSLLDQLLNQSQGAFADWHRIADKRSVFVKAASEAARDGAPIMADILRQAATYAAVREAPEELPGPTGESNTLRSRGRGVAFVFGPEASLPALIAKTLGAGNALIGVAPYFEKLSTYLGRAGAPDDLAVRLGYGDQIPAAILQDRRLSLLAVDLQNCNGDDCRAVRLALSERTAAIIPVLGPESAVWRFGVERTLTINTTAAGGDVRLLSLPE